MGSYLKMNQSELECEREKLLKEYDEFKNKELKLDMSRGKPSSNQLDLTNGMLTVLENGDDCFSENGFDCRNYGLFDGIPEIKEIFSKLLGVKISDVFVAGNSSLNLMFDTVSCFVTKGTGNQKPWMLQENIKFLCPVPGYDRHFGITQYFGIGMINIPMLPTGPDMDKVEQLVSEDESIKGIWCVPKYSNPQGITYSDETVRRLANLKPKAKDFRIIWDNAYCVHDISDTPDNLLNIMDECIKAGNEDLPILFCSTSKITYPGAGVAAMAASEANMKIIREKYKYQTIGYDKLNMLRHVKFLKDYDGLISHMQKHKQLLKPRFDAVCDILDRELTGLEIASWIKPNGGYFISVDVLTGCAKRCVELCLEAGVKLTSAGATYPLGIDPDDSNIRLAPTYPPMDELKIACNLFCLCIKLSALEKLLKID